MKDLHLINRQELLITLVFFLCFRFGIWLKWAYSEVEIFNHFVPEDHLLRRVNAKIDFERIERICKSRYSGKETTIPPVPPIKLFKLYLVMFLFNIESESELVRRAQADFAIRWFCGFGLSDKIPDNSTLSKFRTRLGSETFREIFRYVVRLCVSAKLVKGEHVSIDGSKHLAKARRYTPAEQAKRLVEEFLRRVYETEYIEGETEEDNLQLKELEKSAGKLVGYPLKQPGKILKKIKEEAKSAKIEIKKITNISIMKGKELKDKLKEILSEIPHAVGDKTARIGRTSSNENYCGYLMSFACEYPSGVFTACDIVPANTYCDKLFSSTYKGHKRNLEGMKVINPPKEMSLDKGYDEINVREELSKDNVQAYISLCHRENKWGVYSTEKFEINEDFELKCLAGKLMEKIGKKKRKDGKVRYRGIGCNGCGLKEFCTKGASRVVEIIPEEHFRRQKARESKETPEYKDAMRKRLVVERSIGHAKGYHLMGKAIYRNYDMIKIQQLMSITAYNIEKLVRHAIK